MARSQLNGPAVAWVCPTHPAVAVTLYGLPDALVWCKCGRQMRKSRNIK